MRVNPDNLRKIAGSDSATTAGMGNALRNSAKYIESLQLKNGALVIAALEILRTEVFGPDHPQRIAAHKQLRDVVRDAGKKEGAA